MKGLRRFLDRIKPDFEPGGRFGRLHSTFDAFETFLFVPDKTTTAAVISAMRWTSNGR